MSENDTKLCPDCKIRVIWHWWARCESCAHATGHCEDGCDFCETSQVKE